MADATYAGFDANSIGNYLGLDPATAAAVIAMANGGQPTTDQAGLLQNLPSAEWNNISTGLEHLSQHPLGSHYHNSFVDSLPGKILLNLATGGFYGLGTGLLGAVESGKLSDAGKAVNNLGIYGSITEPINPNLALAGNLAGVGAGVGGALIGSEGALAGAGLGYQGTNMVNGLTSTPTTGAPGAGQTTPAPFPTGGALPGGPSPAQLGALQSGKHPGLAPWFVPQMRGQQPQGGIADQNTQALMMMQQNPSMFMR